MKLCLAILGLGSIALIGNWHIVAADDEEYDDDYGAVITSMNTERVYTIVSKNNILFTKNQSEPTQTIEYFTRFDENLSFRIRADLYDPRDYVIYTSKVGDPLQPCKIYKQGNWDYFVAKLYRQALLPDTGCPTEPGKYEIHRQVAPVTAWLELSPDCGDYKVRSWVETGNSYDSILELRFTFTIKKNCR